MASQLAEYLTYYKTCNEPGYAVLVTGAWGTGKTFQVKTIIPKEARYYVSLFGLKTAEEVHAEVAAAMDPNMTRLKKVLEAGSSVGNAAPGVFKLTGASGSLVNSLLKTKTKNDRTVIFDDLERCSLNIKDTLGVINQYVEHFGCRVVVIAHDDKLAEEFLEAKEKVFGQTILVEPEIDAAFASFCANQKSAARKRFIEQYKAVILSVFVQSEATSLRILKRVLEDVGRLFDTLSEKHLAKSDAISSVVGLFCAFDIETRQGLAEKDLRDRRGRSIRSQMRINAGEHEDLPKFVIAKNKYSEVDLESDLLTDDLLVSMFVKGVFNRKDLARSLDGSVYFTPPAKSQNWRVVMSFDEVEDADLLTAQSSMDADFKNRVYTDPGVLLHVFALKLMMSENGIVPDGLEQVRDACKQYITDLLNLGKLPSMTNDWQWEREYDQSYMGWVYWIIPATAPFWQELFQDLNRARVDALGSKIPDIAADILKLAETDGDTLYKKLNSTPAAGIGEYAYLPVLHHVPVQDFFDAWMKAPKSHWRKIQMAIESRFTAARNGIGLGVESQWLPDLVDLMTAEVAKLNGFQAVRLQRAIPNLR